MNIYSYNKSVLLSSICPSTVATVLAEDWRKEYNRIRPHGSLGYKLPAPEAYEVEKFAQGLAHWSGQVTSDRGGPKEIVETYQTDLVIEAGSVDALVEKISS
jgi:hypothetical protein